MPLFCLPQVERRVLLGELVHGAAKCQRGNRLSSKQNHNNLSSFISFDKLSHQTLPLFLHAGIYTLAVGHPLRLSGYIQSKHRSF